MGARRLNIEDWLGSRPLHRLAGDYIGIRLSFGVWLNFGCFRNDRLPNQGDDVLLGIEIDSENCRAAQRNEQAQSDDSRNLHFVLLSREGNGVLFGMDASASDAGDTGIENPCSSSRSRIARSANSPAAVVPAGVGVRVSDSSTVTRVAKARQLGVHLAFPSQVLRRNRASCQDCRRLNALLR